ncbi:23S rRNA (adenine(2503)-C(2))-methyltransferase RlmN [Clostridium sp.]|uniref:23S rRNA (adenine(2503)-C(2))-methyltransferase RlmN n=1 Tax=Clostridium sp. TaxID=1506 RepID=UPI003992E1B2
MENILNFSLDELKVWMKNNGESAFRAKQIFDWIYKGVYDFSLMKNVPKAMQEKLKEHFYIELPEVLDAMSSTDGTKKFLLKFKDGNIIECVIMKYKHGNTICISTQVGCRMGCKFCASTLEGRVRDLTAGEMLSEVIVAQNLLEERISNIVLMGSGEPLDNYDNVMKFLELVNADYGLNIGQRHITLSTCGIVPKIYEMADKEMQVTLAISLHAVTDEKRKAIMPIANKYSIKEILDACNYYVKKTNRRITFEYSLVSGVNDGKEDARSLGSLIGGTLCHVNLIPVNEIKENTFKKSTPKAIEDFRKILNNYGIEATVRQEKGADINAACGQLRRSYLESK